MKGLTLTEREQTRLQVLNRLVAQRIATHEAAAILGLSERHTWRTLAGYRKEGAAALAHGNRGLTAPSGRLANSERLLASLSKGGTVYGSVSSIVRGACSAYDATDIIAQHQSLTYSLDNDRVFRSYATRRPRFGTVLVRAG